MSSRIYLDHAATTALRSEVADAMRPFQGGIPANPSSLHEEGRAARTALDRARVHVANVLGVRPREIVFTGGGSEADNLAIFGVAAAREADGRHIVTTAIEHHAVTHACDVLHERGWSVSVLPVERDGRLDPKRFASALRDDTVLATVMTANNEIGTVQPIAELAAIAHERGVTFHTDAVQAAGQLALPREADLLSLSAHKFGGPAGVGILTVRDGTPLVAQVQGGGQEYGRRSGTENLAGIVGIAEALALAEVQRPQTAARMAALRDRLFDALLAIPETIALGPRTERLPNNVNVAFAGIPSDAMLARLDLDGVAASAGSACAAGALEPSHVVAALGVDERFARGAIRFSLGRTTTADEIDRAARLVGQIADEMRSTLVVV